MKKLKKINRRKFVQNFTRFSAALVVAMHVPSGVIFSKTRLKTKEVFHPNLFVYLYPDGRCEVVVTRSEMGQGVRTSMSSIVADEMDADWSYVHVLQAEGNPKYGNQNTDGSRSVRTLFMPLRKIGASVREMLVRAAAIRWGVPASACVAQRHFIVRRATGE
ncbi:MAG TPA: xanthine dehydrogenase family protein molybdopterin-binding subunit, partial [Bacteroidetes bacterium]|nr:xanthine dehydrogenase family protein molybdopterin-binding subunit [Bacteroidota bacterium]